MLTSDFTVTTGIVSALGGLRNDTRFLQISAAVQPGNSGGPVLDTDGEIVAVVSRKLDGLRDRPHHGSIFPENINFAIKTGTLRDFLDNSVVPTRPPRRRRTQDHRHRRQCAGLYAADLLHGCGAGG